MFNFPASIFNKVIQLIVVSLLLSGCFIIDNSLFNGLITAKTLWHQSIMALVVLLVCIHLIKMKRIQLKWPDISVAILWLTMMLRDGFNNLAHANPKSYLLSIALIFFLYVFLRSIGNGIKTIKAILVVYLLIVSIQAVIGLLQLYGYSYSHHALFKMTGSFHNPGPFAGFIVSGLPMALVLYQITVNREQLPVNSKQLTVNNEQLVVNRGWRSLFSLWFWRDLLFSKVLCYAFGVQINWDRILNYFAQLVIVILLLALPATRSRAAWLGAIISTVFVAWQFKWFRFAKQWIPQKFINKWDIQWRKLLIPAMLFFLVAFALVVYKFKQGSADGRILMWQVSWEMIKDKPLLGWGQGGFAANYVDYQAEWFKSGKGTVTQEMVAGMPEAPFNELLRIGIHYGLSGVLMILLLVSLLFVKRNKRKQNIEPTSSNQHLIILFKAGLIAVLTFSLFSYPLDIAPIGVQIILLMVLIINFSSGFYIRQLSFLSQLSNKTLVSIFKLKVKVVGMAIGIFVIVGIYKSVKNNYSGLQQWNEAFLYYQSEAGEVATESYQTAVRYLPNNGLLLQMYGKCLAINEEYGKAIEVLSKARNYQSSSIIETTLGDCYQNLEQPQKAEEAYLQACNMEPAKFYPQYLLAKLYHDSDEKEKALAMLKAMNTKKIKIPSMAIKQMKEELNRLLQK